MRHYHVEITPTPQQQKLVDEIMDSLHAAIDDDYLSDFSSLGLGLLFALESQDVDAFASINDALVPLVADPIREFAADAVEHKHLFALVAKRLIDPVLGQYGLNYLQSRSTLLEDPV